MTITEQPAAPVMTLQLKTDARLQEGAAARIKVRWCVSRDLVAHLRELDAHNIHLLISVVNGTTEMRRYLVPIEDELTFVTFERPGVNRVLATVVYGDSFRRMKQLLLTGKMNDFDVDVLIGDKSAFRHLTTYSNGDEEGDADGEKETENWNCHRLDVTAELEVAVDVKMFASNLPTWMRDFRAMFAGLPKNRCSDRKFWMFFAWWGLPVTAVLNTVVKLVMLFFLMLFGTRGIRYRPLFHPISQWPDHITDNISGPIYWYDKHGRRVFKNSGIEKTWRMLFIAYNPPVEIALGAFLLLLHYGDKGPHLARKWVVIIELFGFPALYAALWILRWLVIGFLWLGDILSGRDNQKRQAKREQRRTEREVKWREREEAHKLRVIRELESMTCDVVQRELSTGGGTTIDPKELSFDDFKPKSTKQRIVLWTNEKKVKVCKPYAR